MSLKDKTAIVGVGATPYYRRGESAPQTEIELVGKAVMAALEDAGLTVNDMDGIVSYAHRDYAGELVETLGIPELRFAAIPMGSGGASTAAVGLAAAAVVSGQAETIVVVYHMQQGVKRYGNAMMNKPPSPVNAFFANAGLVGPGHMMAILARRHMHAYGTKREHFAEVAISTRLNAINRPEARYQTELTLAEYFNAPLLADPLCRFDFCMENDAAVAVVVTSAERARDLKQPPAYILGSTHGGAKEWGRGFLWMNMPDDEHFASSGHAAVAKRLYAMAGVGPEDIDVALIYDHFSPMVIMQLEDYGFCKKGEGGQFVADGNIRFKGGSLPVNTHGGQLSEAYVVGMTHIREAVEQIRGQAINQVKDAELALVTGGPATVPLSGMILRR